MREAVSVCMASYNGSNFIRAQIDTILSELEKLDELIIVDDCSNTATKNVLKSYTDPRIKLKFNSTNIGHVKTFERAVSFSKNPIIILADQDDIWVEGRVGLLVAKLNDSGMMLVSSNFLTFREKINVNQCPNIIVEKGSSDSNFMNIAGIFWGSRSYYGCTMAFTRNFLKIVLPIPSVTESHDLWFAIVANVLRKNLHAEEVTIFRRLHSNNVTPIKARSFKSIVLTRIIFLQLVFIALLRKYNF
jgi:glycosyltransferase involved in cell wall biosynthesis